jgi:protein SCO1/2
MFFRLAASCLLAVAGCSRPQAPTSADSAPPPKQAARPATTVVTYKLVGVVKRVSPDAGQVVIAHEAMPGFMNAMTMPFTLKDRDLLAELVAGDEVEGSLRVEKAGGVVKDYQLVDLVVTRPASPPPRVLSLSSKGLTLSEAPKRLETGQAVPDFTMTTQEGRPLKLSELRGRVVVLTFIYTRCPLPDFCPLMDRKMGELAAKVGASARLSGQVRLLSVSFDPEHDTPEVLAKHARVQGAHPPLWTFAVATHAELAKVAAPLGLTYGPTSNEIIHNLCMAVIDPEGRLARLDAGNAVRSANLSDLLQSISRLVAKPSQTRPGS